MQTRSKDRVIQIWKCPFSLFPFLETLNSGEPVLAALFSLVCTHHLQHKNITDTRAVKGCFFWVVRSLDSGTTRNESRKSKGTQTMRQYHLQKGFERVPKPSVNFQILQRTLLSQLPNIQIGLFAFSSWTTVSQMESIWKLGLVWERLHTPISTLMSRAFVLRLLSEERFQVSSIQ